MIKTILLHKGDTVTVNHNIGKHAAGTYRVTSVFEHEHFDTVFFAQVLKHGNVSQSAKRKMVMNTHANLDAPSLATIEAAIKRGAITLEKRL